MSTNVLKRSSISHGRPWQNAEIDKQSPARANSKDEKVTRGGVRTAAVFAGHMLAALAGIAVFKLTGLYDAMDSTAAQIVLGSVIVYWHVIMFRMGLYSK